MKDAEECTKFERRASTRFNANQVVFVGSRLISTVAAAGCCNSPPPLTESIIFRELCVVQVEEANKPRAPTLNLHPHSLNIRLH